MRGSNARRNGMPRYVLLVDWTQSGVDAVEQTVDRLDHGSEIAETFGCEIEHVWWTQGSHDMVSVVHAPRRRVDGRLHPGRRAAGQLSNDDVACVERRRDARHRRPSLTANKTYAARAGPE